MATMNQSWTGRVFEPARVRFVALAVIAVSVMLLVASFWTSDQGQTLHGAGPALGNDFAGFYAAGVLLNRSSEADRLYDFDHQDKLYHALLPKLPATEILPYVHPPFVASAFRLLALLPYEAAYAVWLALSASVYALGCRLMWTMLPTARRSWRWTDALLLALSFEPFIMECWIGGQLSAFGFCFVALAIFYESRGCCFASGLALGLCFYKPTLLVLILPLLVLSGRWRTLAGVVTTGAVLALIGVLTAGWSNSVQYLNVLAGFAKATGGGDIQLRLWKYVDLNAFLRLLFRGRSRFHWLVLILLSAGPLVVLARRWITSRPGNSMGALLAWSAALTWTPILNLYAGVYDTLVILPGLFLTAEAAAGAEYDGRRSRSTLFAALTAAVYVIPWVTQPIARATGVQLYSVALAAVGIYQLRLPLRPIGAANLLAGARFAASASCRNPPERGNVASAGISHSSA